jgi:predicted RNase H-like nuclease (RuvC/YqgF family)
VPEESANELAAAFAQRTKQLYEARGVLGDALAALTEQLNEQRRETVMLREQVAALRDSLERAQLDNRKLEAELRDVLDLVNTMRNMKLMRWTARPRRLFYRARARRG